MVSTREIIDHLYAGEPSQAKAVFEDLAGKKAIDLLETKKVQIAKNFFGQVDEEHHFSSGEKKPRNFHEEESDPLNTEKKHAKGKPPYKVGAFEEETVEEEKYEGFAKVKAAAAKGGARDPGAVAAAIGRKKYGKAKFQKAAAAGKKMKGMKPKK